MQAYSHGESVQNNYGTFESKGSSNVVGKPENSIYDYEFEGHNNKGNNQAYEYEYQSSNSPAKISFSRGKLDKGSNSETNEHGYTNNLDFDVSNKGYTNNLDLEPLYQNEKEATNGYAVLRNDANDRPEVTNGYAVLTNDTNDRPEATYGYAVLTNDTNDRPEATNGYAVLADVDNSKAYAVLDIKDEYQTQAQRSDYVAAVPNRSSSVNKYGKIGAYNGYIGDLEDIVDPSTEKVQPKHSNGYFENIDELAGSSKGVYGFPEGKDFLDSNFDENNSERGKIGKDGYFGNFGESFGTVKEQEKPLESCLVSFLASFPSLRLQLG